VAGDGFLGVPTPPQTDYIISKDNEVGLVLLVVNGIGELMFPAEPDEIIRHGGNAVDAAKSRVERDLLLIP
jgi:hypothetical protein